MNREEAAKRWEWVIENFNDFSVYLWPDQRQELLASIALLRSQVPDPDTGLVPCGCGGKAETHELFGEYSGTYMTDCKECGTGTTQYSTKKESRDAWNTAMGRASE